MGQIFRQSSNKLSRFSILSVCLLIFMTCLSAYAFFQSSYYNDVGVFKEQPIQFSHKHHVQGLGLDCRFCHSAVEKSANAGMPSTETCMNCHNQIFYGSKKLSLITESYSKNIPVQWTKVHDLADFVYFNHSMHIEKNISCQTCHGDVAHMALMSKGKTMTMQWCLECHQHSEKFKVDHTRMTNCFECHR